jgi:hypothetical protein
MAFPSGAIPLALALGSEDYEGWFTRHLVAPRPLLAARNLIA